jgi:hypothetical protein
MKAICVTECFLNARKKVRMISSSSAGQGRNELIDSTKKTQPSAVILIP